MKAKHTIVAFLVLVGLALYVFKFERGDPWEEGQILNYRVEDADRVEVTQADGQKLVLEKRENDWYMVEPIQGMARSEDIDRMVEVVAKFKPKGLREGEDLTDEVYGLSSPAVKVKVWFGDESSEIWIGEEAVAGEHYARIPNDDRLFLVAAITKTDLTKSTDDLREKRVAKFETKDARTVSLAFDDERVRAENDPEPSEDENLPPKNHWRLVEPIDAKADNFAVDDIVRKVSNLSADEFVDDAEGRDAEMGLDNPQVTVGVALEDGTQYSVVLGKVIEKPKEEEETTGEDDSGMTPEGDATDPEPERQVYCRRLGRSETFLVKADVLDDLKKTASDLRDKKLADFTVGDVTGFSLKRKQGASFSGDKADGKWQVRPTGGEGIEADTFRTESLFYDVQDLRAVEFVDGVATSDMAKYGLADPTIIVELTLEEDGKKDTMVVRVGNSIVVEPEPEEPEDGEVPEPTDGEDDEAVDEEPERKKRYYVRIDDEPYVVLVEAEDVEGLHDDLSDFEKQETPPAGEEFEFDPSQFEGL